MKFLEDYKVLLAAIAAAVMLALQQVLGTEVIQWPAVALAVGIAILGVIANEWRGKGVTILGVIGMAAAAFLQVWNGQAMDWNKFAILLAIAILGAISPPAKPASYEKR